MAEQAPASDSGVKQDAGDSGLLVPVETARLRLIPFRLELVRAAQQDPQEVGALLGVGVPADWPGSDFTEILPFLEDWLVEDPGRAAWTRIVEHRDERTLIGTVGFRAAPKARSAEIGYGIVAAYRRQGYAVEAARGLIGWAVGEHGVVEVTAECYVDNLASQAVLARLGLQKTGRDGNLLQWALRLGEP